MLIVSDGPPYEAHGDGFVRALLLSGKITAVPLSDWPSYQETQKTRWNEIQNKIRRGVRPAAPGGAPPAPVAAPAPPPAAPATGGRP
jgi:hypothetical protein